MGCSCVSEGSVAYCKLERVLERRQAKREEKMFGTVLLCFYTDTLKAHLLFTVLFRKSIILTQENFASISA